MHILTIDQGTTGTTAMVLEISKSCPVKILGQDTQNFPQYFLNGDWVEHDLDEIWNSAALAVKNALEKAKIVGSQIDSIGITNQRETVCFFDRVTSAARRKAIVWQCKRSSQICRDNRDLEPTINAKTGLLLDPYFSASKIKWVFENETALKSECENGKTVVGTIDTFLLHRLTGAKVFATEMSNASRTLLFNIHTLQWDMDLLKIFSVKNKDCLAQVCESSHKFGVTKGLTFLPDGIPITGILGDQQAALAGQACLAEGSAKCTYGTGAFLLVNAGNSVKKSRAKLLSTIAWTVSSKTTYALEGSVFVSGAAVQFIRDQFKFIDHSSAIEQLADIGKAAPDLFFVPTLSGLGTPQWNPRARGAFLGLTRGTSISDMARATLEGMALQVADLLTAAQNDLPAPISSLAVDGGASANNLLMKLQASYADIPILRPKIIESTGLGAGFFAALGAGFFADIKEISAQKENDVEFKPGFLPPLDVTRHKNRWKKAINAVEIFAAEE